MSLLLGPLALTGAPLTLPFQTPSQVSQVIEEPLRTDYEEATSPVVVVGYVLNAEIGVYAITGAEAQTLSQRYLASEIGIYTITGQPAQTVHSYVLAANTGTYNITGTAASLLADRLIGATAGSYTITGQAAQVIADRQIAAAASAYTITGNAAQLAHGYLMALAGGSYAITGLDADLEKTNAVVTFDYHDGFDNKKKDEEYRLSKKQFRRVIEQAFESELEPQVAKIVEQYSSIVGRARSINEMPKLNWSAMYADIGPIMKAIEAAREADDEEAICLLMQ